MFWLLKTASLRDGISAILEGPFHEMPPLNLTTPIVRGNFRVQLCENRFLEVTRLKYTSYIQSTALECTYVNCAGIFFFFFFFFFDSGDNMIYHTEHFSGFGNIPTKGKDTSISPRKPTTSLHMSTLPGSRWSTLIQSVSVSCDLQNSPQYWNHMFWAMSGNHKRVLRWRGPKLCPSCSVFPKTWIPKWKYGFIKTYTRVKTLT